MAESHNPKLTSLCGSKKRGHRCIVHKDLKHTIHECFCKEVWEEVKT